jgi:PKD repeat protein
MDASNFVRSKDTWHFLDAIGQVTEAHATEIVNALTAGDTTLANTLLRQYAGESKGWWDYHALNDLLRDALPTDAYNWLRTQIGLTEIGAGTVTNTAKQATLSADDIAKLADAASDSGVMDEATAAVYKSLMDMQGASATKVEELANILKNSPEISAKIGVKNTPMKHLVDLTEKHYDLIKDQLGQTKANSWFKNNAEIARKALDSADPAKMSDIPHAAQEYAASYADVATDMGGNTADDIVKATADLVTQPTSNWQTTAKQTVKNTSNKFWNYFNSLSDAGQERVVHGMIAGALVFAAVVLYKIYTNAGPQSLNHGLFTSKMESMYWPCFHACEDNRANDLDAAIKLYESVINECAESLYEYKTVLESDGTYEEFSITLQIHRFNLSRMKSCLESLQPCGNIHCTSNEDFFYVDLDGQPAGFSYANREILLTAVKTGSHTVKIHKHGYIPESCSKSINVTEGDTKEFDCYMTEVGVCSPVTDVKIYIDPLSPVEDQTVSFNGSASSDDPITLWEWDFGDGFTATGQAVTHPYSSKGIYTIELKVTNDCEETATTTRNVTVSEEEPPVESTTLMIERMIDKAGVDIPRYWEVEVWVDGKYTKCQGPQTLTFGTNEFCDCESPYNFVPCELGTHTITLKKDGYNDLSISVYLEKDTPKTWESPVMEVALGILTLRSNQTGFDGYVDGVHVGNSGTDTRLVVFDVEHGVHTVKISKGVGYMPEYCETSLTMVWRADFRCDMQPVTTRNIDLVLPEGAILWVDGQLIETTVVSRLSAIFRNLRQK